jgi:hypothetical protein
MQATSEFKDFTIVWWNELIKLGTDPQTWNRLKLVMQSKFVPPSYKCDSDRHVASTGWCAGDHLGVPLTSPLRH